jgi:hypothetical protein
LIIIKGYHFWSDWTDTVSKEIDETKIWGFIIYYRLDSWHIIVVTKEESNNKYYPYHTYEIEHQVPFPEMVKLLQNPIAKSMILEIKNYHSSTDFMEKLEKLISTAQNGEL